MYIETCCLRVHHQGSGYTHLGAGCDPPWSLGEPVGISATFSLQFAPTIKSGGQHVSRKRLSTCLAPHLLLMLPKGQLDLIARWACIHKSYRTIANNEAIFNTSTWEYLPRLSSKASMQREQAKYSFLNLSLSVFDYNFTNCCLKVGLIIICI